EPRGANRAAPGGPAPLRGLIRSFPLRIRTRCGLPAPRACAIVRDVGVRSGDPLFRCDESQRVVEWNDAAARLTGIERREAVGRRCWDVIAGTDDAGRPVCPPGCSVDCTELHLQTPAGRRRVSISTIVVDTDETLVLHPIRPLPARPAAAEGARLTPRQREIVPLLANAARATEIARLLLLSETTVRNHIRAVLLELGAHSQLEAVAKARALELVA